ncbi:hypothetical protein BRC71_03705 [Halobacteriales archaeon QH_7_65_31]|nr:MAG: hypothetical protein BRC71_03705 [Halobacteriales archaeon QH_7_65_31]
MIAKSIGSFFGVVRTNEYRATITATVLLRNVDEVRDRKPTRGLCVNQLHFSRCQLSYDRISLELNSFSWFVSSTRNKPNCQYLLFNEVL